MSTELGKALGSLAGALILAILGKVSLPKAIQSLPTTAITVERLLDQTQACPPKHEAPTPLLGPIRAP